MSVSSQNIYSTAGIQLPKDACVVIVKTEWNAETVDKLEEGCIMVLEENNVLDHITLTVPGAFEIPFAIRMYWEANKYKDNKPSAFIALACVLKGDTPHFDFVCRAVTDGILQLNLCLPVPVIFGVLTVENQEQINERTGGQHGHKGKEAAFSALKMIALKDRF